MAEEPNHPVKIRLWMWVIFFLSLAVNLLVVGALVGVLATKPKSWHKTLHASRNLVQPFIQALNPEDRHAFKTEITKSYRRSGGRASVWP